MTCAQAGHVGACIANRIFEQQVQLAERLIAEILAEEAFQRKAHTWFKKATKAR